MRVTEKLTCHTLLTILFLCGQVLRSQIVLAKGVTCTTTNNNNTSSPESDRTDPDPRQVLYILVTGPYPHPFNTGWDQGIALIPAVRLAFKEINQREDILKDYRLETVEDNSGCREPVTTPTIGINSLIETVYYTQNNILSIIGPGCSDTALALAPIVFRDTISLIQISPTATSPVIEIRNYSTTFTMISSSLAYINSFVALMRHARWKRIATLFDELGGNFRATHLKFVEKLNSMPEYSIIYTSHIYDNEKEDVIYLPLEDLKSRQARIIQVFAGKGTVQKIICLAYHLNMTYPQYQWVFNERSLKDFTRSIFFEYNGSSYNCTKKQMTVAANASILNKYALIQEEDEIISVTNHTYSLYREQYNEEFKKHFCEQKTQDILAEFLKSTTKKSLEDYNKPTGSWENAYYDAAWTMGLALNKLSETGLNLSHYGLGQPEVTRNLMDELLRVQFTGATGPVQFSSESRSVRTRIIITQLFIGNDNTSELSETQVAEYHENLTVSTNKVSFLEDSYKEIPIQVHLALGIIIIIFTVAVIIFTVFLQIIFITCHYKRSIKATSPNINHLVFSGCYLFLLATILYVAQQSFLPHVRYQNLDIVYAIFCNTITWCLLLGFSLIFGTVFVKVWRIFRLFKHFRNESPGLFLSDDALVATDVLFLALDVFICLLWNALDPWMLKREIRNVLQKDDQEVLVYYSCTCNYVTYWIGSVTAYKGTIALLLVIFSILNRKIQRKDFSHTKRINILVYGITMLGGAGYPLYFLLSDINTNIYPSFVIFCCILLVTVCLCCLILFLPPVVPILRERLGVRDEDKLTQHFRRKLSTISLTGSFFSSDDYM